MSEQKYPRAWLIWDWIVRKWVDNVFDSEESARHWSSEGDRVCELIPLTDHESLVAAERAAERERCAAIAKQVAINISRGETQLESFDTAFLIERRIREVPE